MSSKNSAAVRELGQLLKNISPEIQNGEYVFCTFDYDTTEHQHLDALASFKESEGLTLILPLEIAKKEKLEYDGIFKQITLKVHSCLHVVGLTAAVSEKLTSNEISANIIAAYYHDHIFVPKEQAEQALLALKEFTL